MVRTGASSPIAPPRKITTAAASGFGAMISSFVESYAMPCVVRLNRVSCPWITLAGATFPFASLANAAIRGWLTQFGTRISCRFVSYATEYGLPKPLVSLPAGALRMMRRGRTLPVASRGNTSAV